MVSLAPRLINVNEFLPTHVYKLHKQVRSKCIKKKMYSLHFFVEEKSMQDRRRVINLFLSILSAWSLKFFESGEIAHYVNLSKLYSHPHRLASSLSSTVFSFTSHIPNVTTVNHSLSHTHSVSSPSSSHCIFLYYSASHTGSPDMAYTHSATSHGFSFTPALSPMQPR